MGTRETRADLTRCGPGKFDYLIDEIAYELSLDGCDDECGDAETTDWFGILRGFQVDGAFADLCAEQAVKCNEADLAFLREHAAGCIMRCDNNGFVTVTWHSNEKSREKEWRTISREVAKLEAQAESG